MPLITFSQNETGANFTDGLGQKQGLWIEKTGELEIAGNYVDDRKDGSWLSHFTENGMLFRIENFNLGRKEGIFIELSKRGYLVSEQFFSNDLPDGPYRQYGQVGMLASVYNYSMGKLHGMQITYYENQQKKKSEEAGYKYGIKDGPSRWYDTEGNLIVEYNYVDGLLQGEQKSFYAGNKIRTSDIYVDNALEGASLEYYESGNIKVSGHYKAGLMDGKWLEYDENGTILKTTNYTKGEIK